MSYLYAQKQLYLVILAIMQSAPYFVKQFGLVFQAAHVVVLNLRNPTTKLLWVMCLTISLLFVLILSIEECALIGNPLVDFDFRYHRVLKLQPRVSLQIVFSSLGSALSSQVLDANRGFKVPQGVQGFNLI